MSLGHKITAGRGTVFVGEIPLRRRCKILGLDTDPLLIIIMLALFTGKTLFPLSLSWNTTSNCSNGKLNCWRVQMVNGVG